jgi:hypothetical protein
MISLETARKLKQAGLVWKPALFDFFAIPDRDLDDRVFVIADMPVMIENLFGAQVVSFQGASEWALDSLVTSELVWLPSETQLRQCLQESLLAAGNSGLRLTANLAGYSCEFKGKAGRMSFRASQACEAYALALLNILEKRHLG